jgi:hypothetical protein
MKNNKLRRNLTFLLTLSLILNEQSLLMEVVPLHFIYFDLHLNFHIFA